MHIKKQRLLTPGPTPLLPKAMHAMMDCDVHHRTEDFRTVYRAVLRDLKDVMGTAGDVIVLCCRGPLGAGMEEIAQVTIALKNLPFGKHVAVLTEARFSGVSTGACVGHVGPEALAGGPIGKVLDGDRIRIVIDRNRLEGSVDLIGEREGPEFGPEEGGRVLARRSSGAALSPSNA